MGGYACFGTLYAHVYLSRGCMAFVSGKGTETEKSQYSICVSNCTSIHIKPVSDIG